MENMIHDHFRMSMGSIHGHVKVSRTQPAL